MHPSLGRLYELAQEHLGISGPTALAKALQETTQGVNNWSRGRGVSNKGAMKAQKLYEWSAAWIMEGTGPRLVRPTISELIEAPVVIPKEMVTYSAIVAELMPFPEGKGDVDVAKLEPIDKARGGYVLVIFPHKNAKLEAYCVAKNVFTHNNRLNAGEFVVVDLNAEPQVDDEVLVGRGKDGARRWALERFAFCHDGMHYFFDPKSESKVKFYTDVSDLRVMVAINSRHSLIPAAPIPIPAGVPESM